MVTNGAKASHPHQGRCKMGNKEAVIKEIEEVPEPFLEEVLDLVHFLKAKITKERLETAMASESALKKDWLRPEEDEAWRSL